MKRSTLRIALLLAALLAITSSAWAGLANVSVTGTVWRVDGNMLNAPTADPVGGTLLGTFTANQINFWAAGPQGGSANLGDFLAFGGANVANMTSGLGQVMSNCTSGTSGGSECYTTIIRINGIATFNGGNTYTLRHDDGAVMYAGANLVINSAAPTSPTDSHWTPGSTFSGPFTIYYSGTNGNPEQLRLDGNVPDGGVTIMLLGAALLGVGTLHRKWRG